MEAWPSTLQTILNTDNFNYQIGETAITSEMDTGIPKKRRRFTDSIDTLNVSIDMPYSDFEILKTFFNTTLGGGVKTFAFDHPFTGTPAEFQMIDTPKLGPKTSGGIHYLVTMQWRLIP